MSIPRSQSTFTLNVVQLAYYGSDSSGERDFKGFLSSVCEVKPPTWTAMYHLWTENDVWEVKFSRKAADNVTTMEAVTVQHLLKQNNAM